MTSASAWIIAANGALLTLASVLNVFSVVTGRILSGDRQRLGLLRPDWTPSQVRVSALGILILMLVLIVLIAALKLDMPAWMPRTVLAFAAVGVMLALALIGNDLRRPGKQ